MCSPATSNARQKLDVLLWWWVCALLDTGSRHTINVLELDVRDGCRERHRIAAVGTEGKVEHEDLLELWSVRSHVVLRGPFLWYAMV